MFRVGITISAFLVKMRDIMFKNKTLVPWKIPNPNFVTFFVLIGMAFSFVSEF